MENKKSNKKFYVFIILIVLLVLISLIYFLNKDNEIKSTNIIELKKDIKVLTKENKYLIEENSILKLKGATLMLDNTKLKKELESSNKIPDLIPTPFESIKNNFVFVDQIKIISMDVGQWHLDEKYKEEIKSKLDKDIYFYEIIPIVDNKNYLNDPFELKQLGLTRKRSSVAVTLLRSLNPKNQIYLSIEVVVSDNNERGFIIKRFKYIKE